MNYATKFRNQIFYNRILKNKELEIKNLFEEDYNKILPFINLGPLTKYRNNVHLIIDYDYLKNKFRIGIQKKSFQKMLELNIDHPLINFGEVLNKYQLLDTTEIIRTNNLIYCSDLTVKISEYFEEFINENSKLLEKNIFRGIQIREAQHNEKTYFMIIIKLYFLENNSIDEQNWNLLESKLIDYFEYNFNQDILLASIYKQITYTKKESTNIDEFKLVHKKYDLIQKINNFYFKISPGAFFQINIVTAKQIYNKVKFIYLNEISKANIFKDEVVILDICCGTGTIGIFLSDHCNKVLGFEINKNAIDDCIFNSKYNNKTNTQYLKGPVEDTIQIINTMNEKHFIPIINPPKRGLYKNVIDILNFYKDKIKFIIYVSCNPKTFYRDYKLLGDNFFIEKVNLVDQFPLTNDTELIAILKRK